MTLVRLVVQQSWGGHLCPPGTLLDIPEEEAGVLVNAGVATPTTITREES